MSITELIQTISFCECHKPVAKHKDYKIYIHGYRNGCAYISQIYGKGKALFVKVKVTASKFMVVRLKDFDGEFRTVAINTEDFIPTGSQMQCAKIPAGEVIY